MLTYDIGQNHITLMTDIADISYINPITGIQAIAEIIVEVEAEVPGARVEEAHISIMIIHSTGMIIINIPGQGVTPDADC